MLHRMLPAQGSSMSSNIEDTTSTLCCHHTNLNMHHIPGARITISNLWNPCVQALLQRDMSILRLIAISPARTWITTLLLTHRKEYPPIILLNKLIVIVGQHCIHLPPTG